MRRSGLIGLVAFAASALCSAVLYPRLPGQVPSHWDLDGAVNGTTSRLGLAVGGPLMVLGIWGLLALLLRIDPKRARPRDPEATEAERDGTIPAVLAIVPGLLALLHGVLLLSGAGLLHDTGRAHALILAAFLIVFGNFAGRLRPTWFIGIRTPWTLSSDEVWRDTHRLAGWLMVPAGLMAVPLALFLPSRLVVLSTISLLLAATLGPAVYSYFAWRRRSA